MRAPVDLETAVLSAARAVLGERPLATGALTRAIVDRSQRYTSDRDRLATPRDADGDLAARAAFFTIADAMKIALPLRELAARDALPSRRPLRVTDLGAGCGAMSLGAIATLAELGATELSITAIDHDRRALAIAERAIRDYGSIDATRRIGNATIRVGDVTSATLPAADLVIMGTVLNELAPDAARAVIERALASVSDDGAVIAIEPALRDTSRHLHAIRDAVLAGGAGHVFAPCTRRCTPCTALADPDDWCHEDRPLELPPRTAELARLTHLRDGGMKFSYLVLRRQPRALADDDAWRLVSAPFVAKGKHEVIGCGERGRVTLRLLKRHRNAGNRELEKADRGDLAVLEPAGEIAGDRLEIGDGTAVHITRMLPR